MNDDRFERLLGGYRLPEVSPDLDRRVLREGAAIMERTRMRAAIEEFGRTVLDGLGFGYLAWLVDLCHDHRRRVPRRFHLEEAHHERTTFRPRRRERFRLRRHHLVWIIPLGLIAAVGLFYGLGILVTWLWRVTRGATSSRSSRSASGRRGGSSCSSQILFKANMQPTTRTGRWRRHRDECGPASETQPEPRT